MHRPVNIALALLLLSGVAFSQRSSRCEPANLRVRVLYSNSRSARSHTEVQLLSPAGGLVTQRFSDDSGNVEFVSITATSYRVRVKDQMVEDYTSDLIGLACGENHSELVTVELKHDAQVMEKQLQAK